MANRTIEQEQEDFERLLPDMMRAHHGKYVLFKDGAPVLYCDGYEQAYEEALLRFGVDATFLIMQVKKYVPKATSLSWEAGVMFGE